MTDAVGVVEAMFGRVLRVSVNDGRTFEGELTAFDAQGNLILEQTIERSVVDGYEYARDIGFALVPKREWNKIELLETVASASASETLSQHVI